MYFLTFCPFCTYCFCLGVRSLNSYTVLEELLEIPCWYTTAFPPRVWARPQDNTFSPQPVEEVMEEGAVNRLGLLPVGTSLASRNPLEPVLASCSGTALNSELAFQEPMPVYYPVPSVLPSLSSFLNLIFFNFRQNLCRIKKPNSIKEYRIIIKSYSQP